MATAQVIFTQAWIDLGVGEPGQIPSASQSVNGLNKLNQFLDMLSGMREMIYEIAMTSYTLSHQQSFQIGPTAAAPFNVPRPIKIETADIVLTIAGATPQSNPLRIIPQDEWRQITDLGSEGTTPEHLWVDPSVPNSVLNLHPIPRCNIPTAIQLGVWQSIPQFASLATNVSLPPAYFQFLVLGLQLLLAPTYGNLVNPVILQMRSEQFKEAYNAVTKLNATVQVMPLPSTPTPQTPTAASSGSNPQLAQLLQELRTQSALQRQV